MELDIENFRTLIQIWQTKLEQNCTCVTKNVNQFDYRVEKSIELIIVIIIQIFFMFYVRGFRKTKKPDVPAHQNLPLQENERNI